MRISTSPRLATAAVTATLTGVLSLSLTGCSGDDAASTVTPTGPAVVEAAAGTDENGVPLSDATGAAVTPEDLAEYKSGLIGAGCAALKDTRAGKELLKASKTPVADLLDSNPLLSGFGAWLTGETVEAVDKSERIAALAAKDDLTLVVPRPEAIEAIPSQAIENFRANPELFSNILGYHVVTKRVQPAELAEGPVPTLHGAELVSVQTETGPGLDTSLIVCGGIRTADAIIYLVDSVILPPAS